MIVSPPIVGTVPHDYAGRVYYRLLRRKSPTPHLALKGVAAVVKPIASVLRYPLKSRRVFTSGEFLEADGTLKPEFAPLKVLDDRSMVIEKFIIK